MSDGGASSVSVRGHRSNWEMVSGVVALVVGVAALGVTTYTSYLTRKQAHASVWPRLILDESDTPSFGVFLVNKGVGPAVVRTVDVQVDGRPTRTWPEVFERVLGDEKKHEYRYSTMEHSVLTAGETVQALVVLDPALEAAMGHLGDRLKATICYCSIFDECWQFESATRESVAVPTCPVGGSSSFTQ